MPTQKDIAEFFRFALRFGLIEKTAVELWTDSIIDAEPIANCPFTDLSSSSRLSRSAVDELLGHVTGSGEPGLVGHMLLALLRRRVRDGSLTPETAIKLALEAGWVGATSEKERSGADMLDDSLWLATNETYGTIESAHQDIAEFFERYADFDKHIPALP